MNCIIKINPPMSFCHFNMFPRKFKITTCGSGCISVERPCAPMRWVGRTQRKGVGGGNSPGVLGYRTEWWPLLTGSGSHRGLLSRRGPLRGGRGAQAWEGQGTTAAAVPVGSSPFHRAPADTCSTSHSSLFCPGSASRSPSSASSASGGESLSEEELAWILEQVEDRKKLIATMRNKPWPMTKKLRELR